VNFRSFFEWYRNREDIENEQLREAGRLVRDSQLEAVRRAIRSFIPGFSDISVRRFPLRMEVLKNGQRIRVDQMSDGEKCLFALVGDLSRRLAIANPAAQDPLLGEGIVLIDEIDLHLHPSWQRTILKGLKETFPKCQFVISTHSPQVFGEAEASAVRILVVDEVNELQAKVPNQALGLDAAEILEELMGTDRRNSETSTGLNAIYQLVEAKDLEGARSRIEEMSGELNGDIPELVRARSLIRMLEAMAEDINEGD
jgi:predicted ATP-binding protein involved in virulence